MARIAGINLPAKKRIEVALTYIYGSALAGAGDPPPHRGQPRHEGDGPHRAGGDGAPAGGGGASRGGDLRRQVRANIQRLIDIGCYRGLRHKVGLPVRGQKTRTNARTWKAAMAKAGKRK